MNEGNLLLVMAVERHILTSSSYGVEVFTVKMNCNIESRTKWVSTKGIC